MSGMAKDWPITQQWDSANKDWNTVKKSMTDIMGADHQVGVFELPSKFEKHITNAYSFALAH